NHNFIGLLYAVYAKIIHKNVATLSLYCIYFNAA
ncbi:MAG: hypothetical protein ACI97P_000552, partial [Arcticibacterium sp.]